MAHFQLFVCTSHPDCLTSLKKLPRVRSHRTQKSLKSDQRILDYIYPVFKYSNKSTIIHSHIMVVNNLKSSTNAQKLGLHWGGQMAVLRTTTSVILRGIFHRPLISISRFSGTLGNTRRGISLGRIRCAASESGDGRKVSSRLSQVQQLLQEAEERALSADNQPAPKITLGTWRNCVLSTLSVWLLRKKNVGKWMNTMKKKEGFWFVCGSYCNPLAEIFGVE
jgi:hypothetical protein